MISCSLLVVLPEKSLNPASFLTFPAFPAFSGARRHFRRFFPASGAFPGILGALLSAEIHLRLLLYLGVVFHEPNDDFCTLVQPLLPSVVTKHVCVNSDFWCYTTLHGNRLCDF